LNHFHLQLRVAMEALRVTSDVGVLAVLTGVCVFFFWLERATRWRLFQYLPPLVFIYLAPVLLTNSGVIAQFVAGRTEEPAAAGILPAKSGAYDAILAYGLPMMLTLMLINVDVKQAIALAGRGVGVMLFGAAGVVVGAVLGYWLVHPWLEPTAWKAFGALTGTWVGGTGNLQAVAAMFEAADGTEVALATIADTSLLLVWMPVMLGSKRFAARFARFSQVDAERVARLDAAAAFHAGPRPAASYQDFLLLLFLGFAVTWGVGAVAPLMPKHDEFLSIETWRMLLVTTIGVALSFTRLNSMAGSRELGMALIFLFMARTGAKADLAGALVQAGPFLAGASVCLVTHGVFCLIGAKLLRVDIHTAAIASAANVGGVATASVVAAHHKESLVPAGILLALLGYAIGNYAGLLAAALCRLVI
jgi:uncharacterized membrane protein